MTTKAKCPACGDEEGNNASVLSAMFADGIGAGVRDWLCAVCNTINRVDRWRIEPTELTRLHPDDIEALIEGTARRVVELMGEKG